MEDIVSKDVLIQRLLKDIIHQLLEAEMDTVKKTVRSSAGGARYYTIE